MPSEIPTLPTSWPNVDAASKVVLQGEDMSHLNEAMVVKLGCVLGLAITADRLRARNMARKR